MSYHLKLRKGLSYFGNGITATKEHPDVFVDSKTAADAAVSSGYFKLVGGSDESASGGSLTMIDGHLDPEQLSKMKVDELKRLAADMGVDISNCKNKAETVAVLAAAEVKAPDEPDDGINMDELAEMDEEALRSYAEAADIDLTDCETKEDILAAISVASGGSLTMIDLQHE